MYYLWEDYFSLELASRMFDWMAEVTRRRMRRMRGVRAFTSDVLAGPSKEEISGYFQSFVSRNLMCCIFP